MRCLAFRLALLGLVCLLSPVYSYSEEKVNRHFWDLDLNKDGNISRAEFIDYLKEDDIKDGVVEPDESYQQLTEALYDKYDMDLNEQISLQEWHYFAQDIADQTDPNFMSEYGGIDRQDL